MKKATLRSVVLAVVTLAIYNLIVFLAPFARGRTFWVSYGFTVAAFAIAGASVHIAVIKKPDATSRFYGFPIARLGLIYVLVQLIVSFAVMTVGAWIAWWIPTLIYAIGLGVVLIGMASVEAVVEDIHAQDDKLKRDVSRMRSLQSKVSQMAAESNHASLKALAEEFKYSDPVSNEAIAEADADLTAAVFDLQAAFVDGDRFVVEELCQRTSALLAERNRLCKLNKK